jgi:hypothetical protein
MYNTHDTITVEPEREYDEKRQDDDRKTKQKMELIRSKLKTHARKVKISYRVFLDMHNEKRNELSSVVLIHTIIG